MSSQLITFRDIWGAKGPGMAGMVDMTLHPYQSGSYVSRMSDMQSNLLISYDDMMGFKWFLYVFIILCDFYHFYIEIIYIYIEFQSINLFPWTISPGARGDPATAPSPCSKGEGDASKTRAGEEGE